ncbi:MAG: hypothetical protein QM639_02405 [Rhodocyclaceae bacterium]
MPTSNRSCRACTLVRALLCLMLSIAAWSPCMTQAAPAPHEAGLRKIMQIFGFDEFMVAELQRNVAKLQANNDTALAATWLAQDDMDGMRTVVVEEFARFSTPEEVTSMLAFLATPTGKRFAELARQSRKGGPPPDVRRYFTAADDKVMAAFVDSPGLRMLERFKSAELAQAMRRRGLEYGKNSFAAYLRKSPAQLPIRVNLLVTEPDLPGLAILDDKESAQWPASRREAVQYLLQTAQTVGRANQRYLTLLRSGLSDIVAPETLVSLDAINTRLETITQVEQALDVRNAALMAAVEGLSPYSQALADPALPPGLGALFNSQLPTYMAFHDNQKRVFALYRRLFVLARDQYGHIAYQNKVLNFDDDGALMTFREVIAQLGQEAKLEEELLQRMDNASAATTPPAH